MSRSYRKKPTAQPVEDPEGAEEAGSDPEEAEEAEEEQPKTYQPLVRLLLHV